MKYVHYLFRTKTWRYECGYQTRLAQYHIRQSCHITGKVELVEFHQACTMVGGTTVYHSPTIEKSIPQVQPKSGNEIDAFVALKIKKCYFEQDG